MPNVDNPNGFIPSRHLKGGVIRASQYQIASGSAGPICSGDAVILTADGVILVATAGATNLIGVFGGVEWTAEDGECKFSRFWPNATVTKGGAPAKAYVYDDPDIAFAVQGASGTAFTQNMVGANCDITITAGSVVTGQSAHEATIGTLVQTTAQLRILGLIPRADNALGEHADIEVFMLEHLNRAGSAVLGI